MDIKIINNFIINLTASFRNVQIYAKEHPLIIKSITKTLHSLGEIFEERDELTLFVIAGELIIKEMQFGRLAVCSSALAKALRDTGVERVTFIKGVQKDELIEFASMLKRGIDGTTVKASQHIKIGKLKVKIREYEPSAIELGAIITDGEVKSESAEFEMIDKAEFDKMRDIYNSFKKHKKVNVIGVEDIVGNFMTTFKREISPLLSLATLKSYDEYTYVHAANVSILTMAQAEFLGLDDNILHNIGVAAMVHDVGKVFVPDEILNKQGKLDPEEWEIMMSHPVKGARFLANSAGIPQLAVVVAFEHHMRNDLSGYPKVRGDYKLHFASQMVNIADFYDALSTVRPYREPLSKYKVFEMLRESSNKEFDAFLVENFISMMESTKKE